MKKKTVYIEYKFVEGPYGGANQFLKTLREYFVKNEIYANTAEEADFILINHTNISKETLEIKKNDPEKIVIHRMDGPVSKHRKRSIWIDFHSFFLDKLLCNGSIFQSEWTKDNCFQIGYKQTGEYTIIHNAPNPDIFFPKEKVSIQGRKIKLVMTSWSPNYNKGFDVLEYLDHALDFEKYELTFIGRTSIEFKNIKCIEALGTKELSIELKKHDIFIAASRNESCSNSLLEAINSGLVIVARESGCYKEVIKSGGVLFHEVEEAVHAIEEATIKFEQYKLNLPYYDIINIGTEYYNFMLFVAKQIENKKIQRKIMTSFKIMIWDASKLIMKCYEKYNRICEKLLDNSKNI